MMTFHVACPITCERICFCKLGFPQKLQSEKARLIFSGEIARLSQFLIDPLNSRARDGETVQVSVPKAVKPSPVVAPAKFVVPVVLIGDGDGIDVDEELFVQNRRVAMHKKAVVTSIAAEDYARRFECGDLLEASRDVVGDEQGQSGVNVICRMCYNGENEGSERERRMLSCKTCSKKYHRSCIKNWAQHRDLFHWSSWTCPSCRICELCRKTGDSNKFKFCKRCDGAFHCYCQHPPHKNVSAGPYLCQKHTGCHSCASNVPGNGLSVRWFLGYTCCDACGRLFVKGKYCPVCLKVYRDSESTPMVCCDACQRWVHCQCDGISDEKYMQFQADGNLQYKCATCRGECYEVKDLDGAVRELWRRRDEADRDLIANQRAAAGLPIQEEIFSISPYSDDDEDGPILLKNEYGRSLKFCLKGAVEKSPNKTKEQGNKSFNEKNLYKKEYQTSLVSKMDPHQGSENHHDPRSDKFILSNNNKKHVHSNKIERPSKLSTPGSMSHAEGFCSINQPGVVEHKFVDEVTQMNNQGKTHRTVRLKDYKAQGIDATENTVKNKSNNEKGTPKLVIHLGSRRKNLTNSAGSDVSSCRREQELTTSYGSEDAGQKKTSGKYVGNNLYSDTKPGCLKGDKGDSRKLLKSSTHGAVEGNSIKIQKSMSETSDINLKYSRRNVISEFEVTPKENMLAVLGKRTDKVYFKKGPEETPDLLNECKDDSTHRPSASQSLPKDAKPSLKLKFKNPYNENQSSLILLVEDEKNFVKGQRSKRKRAASFMDKTTVKDDGDYSQVKEQGQSMDGIMDANWILKKLGKDAMGKRVEVHQPSDNSWNKGVVSDVIEGTSILSVELDDGRSKKLELGKQGIRFVSDKRKRSRT